MIIAIDGPAASGKGTLARRLAAHYGLRHLDTGMLYRAVALHAMRAGLPPTNEAAIAAAAKTLDPALCDDPALREEGVGQAASKVAAMPEVRAALLQVQRDFARHPPGAVLDGRDIGTVVLPDADVKLFVTASAEERARRRHRELMERGEEVGYEAVLADIRRRDERDAARAIAPLRPAADAHLLDTTKLDIDSAFREARRIIDAHLNTGAGRHRG